MNCAESLASDLQSEKNIGYVVINMLDINIISEKVQKAADIFPEKQIDILVNCAGVISSSSFEDMMEREYDTVMDINMKGTYFMCQAVCQHMKEKKIRGHILNVSSSSALRPAWNPYQISKWAVKGFTKGLADIMIPYGIVVNAIAPGPVATSMLNREEGDTLYNENNPSKRFAMPDEIANLALFMVSDMGNMIVGDTFYITGGSGVISLHK